MKNERFNHVVVMLDSSSLDGDSGAELASSLFGADGQITLVASLTGPEALGLQAFADAEGLPVPEAAAVYLTQVAERLDHEHVETVVLDGQELAEELIDVVKGSAAGAVVMPADLAARIMATKRNWGTLAVPVLMVPEVRTAA